MIEKAPIAPSAPPAKLQTRPEKVHSPFSPRRCSHTDGTITATRKYASPTHTNGLKLATAPLVDIATWPERSVGPYIPNPSTVTAIEPSIDIEFRMIVFPRASSRECGM